MSVILIIDDDKFTVKVLDSQLSAAGYRVLIAQEGKKGVETATSANPDLILLDINMPGMDGLEVLKHIKKHAITKNTPVIMLTGVTEKDSILNAMRQGVLDYIIKPYDAEILQEKIKSAIRYSSLKRREIAEDRTENISVYRDENTILITIKDNFRNKKVLSEAKTVFNPVFFRNIQKHKCVIDLRHLTDFDSADVSILKIIIKLFGKREVLLVAGRHYGTIVAQTNLDDIDFGERVHFFISFGDLQIFLKKSKRDN